MSDDNRELDPNNPEDMKKLREFAKKAAKEVFSSPVDPDFDERDLASGDPKNLENYDEHEYLEELDKYTPEERRKKLKILKNKE